MKLLILWILGIDKWWLVDGLHCLLNWPADLIRVVPCNVTLEAAKLSWINSSYQILLGHYWITTGYTTAGHSDSPNSWKPEGGCKRWQICDTEEQKTWSLWDIVWFMHDYGEWGLETSTSTVPTRTHWQVVLFPFQESFALHSTPSSISWMFFFSASPSDGGMCR
jgi:hypothetical protein